MECIVRDGCTNANFALKDEIVFHNSTRISDYVGIIGRIQRAGASESPPHPFYFLVLFTI